MIGCNNSYVNDPSCEVPVCAPSINQGENKTLQFNLVLCSTRQPFNISAATALTVVVPSTNDAGYIEKTLGSGVAIVNGGGGIMSVSFTPDDTETMVPGPNVAEIQVTISGVLTIVQLQNAFNVNAELFPGTGG